MSVVAQAVATVAATPLPSPQVIKEVVTQVVPAQVPAVVVQAAQIAGVFVAVLIFSVSHQVAEWLTAKEKGWGLKTNTLLATFYSFGVGTVGAATMHQLGTNLSDLVALGVTTSVALAGSFWTYAVRKALAQLTGLGAKIEPVVNQDPAPALAIEQPPVG